MSKANEYQIQGTHYKVTKLQPWDAVHLLGLNYYTGTVLKYICRYKQKNGIEDLKKAIHFLEKLIEIEEQEQDEKVPVGYQGKAPF